MEAKAKAKAKQICETITGSDTPDKCDEPHIKMKIIRKKNIAINEGIRDEVKNL